MESALELKRRNPQMTVFVLYRDLRTYGEREDLYNQARKEGIIFIRYDLENKPKVFSGEQALEIEVLDHVLGKPVKMEVNLLTLATAIVPESEEELARYFKIPMNELRFFY